VLSIFEEDTFEVEGIDGFAKGRVFEQVQVVEKLPGAYRRVSPVTVSCRITETRLCGETARKAL
jgi:hypothetical protein